MEFQNRSSQDSSLGHRDLSFARTSVGLDHPTLSELRAAEEVLKKLSTGPTPVSENLSPLALVDFARELRSFLGVAVQLAVSEVSSSARPSLCSRHRILGIGEERSSIRDSVVEWSVDYAAASRVFNHYLRRELSTGSGAAIEQQVHHASRSTFRLLSEEAIPLISCRSTSTPLALLTVEQLAPTFPTDREDLILAALYADRDAWEQLADFLLQHDRPRREPPRVYGGGRTFMTKREEEFERVHRLIQPKVIEEFLRRQARWI